MKKSNPYLIKTVLVMSFLLFGITSNAQHFTVTLRNFTSTVNTMEFDIVLIVDAPVQGVKLSALATGIMYNPDILNSGDPCTTTNCGSFVSIPGSRSPELVPLQPVVAAHGVTGPGHIRTTQTPVPGFGVDLLPGTYTLDRMRFTNTVPWTPNSDAQLWLSPDHGVPGSGTSNTIVVWYPYGSPAGTNSAAYTTTSPANGAGLTLGYTETSPMSRVLNPSLSVLENDLNPLQIFPNPFNDSFGINFETISNEPVTVKVFDMIGKIIDSRTVDANTINTLRIGENYQSGIYNVTVSQDGNTHNSRVIKK